MADQPNPEFLASIAPIVCANPNLQLEIPLSAGQTRSFFLEAPTRVMASQVGLDTMIFDQLTVNCGLHTSALSLAAPACPHGNV